MDKNSHCAITINAFVDITCEKIKCESVISNIISSFLYPSLQVHLFK